MSGLRFMVSYRHPYLNLNPVTISSRINSAFTFLAYSCNPLRYSFVAGMHPPPPRTGSTMIPASSFFADCKISNDFSKSLYGRDTMCSSSTSPMLSGSLNGQFTFFRRSVVYPCQPPSIFAITFLPVTARASLTAYIVASVPVDA